MWQPGPEVQDHAGIPLRPGMDFFADPPPEIGEVVSATTSLTADRQPRTAGSRGLTVGTVAVIAGGLASWGIYAAGVREPGPQLMVGGIVAATAALIAWVSTSFKHACSFVGKQGVARFRCSGDRSNAKRTHFFLFPDAVEVRSRQVRNYLNGVYTGTAYDYAWTDERGARKFRLQGTYQSKEGTPKPKDPFHFAHAAEVAWSVHLLDRAQEQLNQTGSIAFNLSGGGWIKVGPGFIEFCVNKVIERVEAADMGDCQISEGTFTFKRKGAKSGFLGIGRQGIYSFDYANMANGKLFLLVLDKLMGMRFQ